MKKLFLLFALLFALFTNAQNPKAIVNEGGFGAGVYSSGTISTKSLLDIRSTTKGVLFPRMSTTQRNAISSPDTSLWIFNTTTGHYNYYTGSNWSEILSASELNLQQIYNNGGVSYPYGHVQSADGLTYFTSSFLNDGGNSIRFYDDGLQNRTIIQENSGVFLVSNLSQDANHRTVINLEYGTPTWRYEDLTLSKATTFGMTTPTTNSSVSIPAPTILGDYYTGISINGIPFGADGDVSIPNGTVTNVSVITANGVTGSVANSTTTPAITLSLGAITPTTVVASSTISGSNLSGTNTGDQTTVTGNSGTATALQTARTIGIATGDVTSAGSSFNGTANNTNALTLATVNSNVGTFGGTGKSLTATANGKGLVTAIAEQSILITESQVTNLTTDLSTITSNISTNTSNISTNTTNIALRELLSNKATTFSTLNNTLYPTTQAIANYVGSFGYGTVQNSLSASTTVAPSATAVNTGLATKDYAKIILTKTANYTLGVNEFIAADTTSGSITLTLPTAPVDGTLAGAKLSVLAGSNTVGFVTGGSDVINVASGATTATLNVLNQVVIFQYKASSGIWYATDSSISKTYIDAQDLTKKDKAMDALVLQGKTIVFFGNSYTSGTGATNTGRRFSTLLSSACGSFESNNGVQGTTIEKRVPINYINSPNMVDNATNIPTYSATTHGLLVFEFGLNDIGQNGANYTTANFITDFQTVLTTAITTKGWVANKILILGAPYANSTGYAAYAALSGNAAPTVQRHLDFIEAARQVAATNGTLFLDLYQLQVKNDIVNTMAADGYHPNDAGHYAIARMIANFLGYNAMFESRVSLSSSNPFFGGLGGTFSNAAGDQTKMKWAIFNDGTNKCGFGASANVFEYHTYSGSTHNFYIASTLSSTISANGFKTLGFRTAYGAKTATYTVLASDYTINCTTGTFTVTLLSAATAGAGSVYVINNSGTGVVTVATTSSQTIDGVTTKTLSTQNSNITVQSDGANWIILSAK